jgi:hypothetical protein
MCAALLFTTMQLYGLTRKAKYLVFTGFITRALSETANSVTGLIS